MGPVVNVPAIEAATKVVMGMGHRLLQTHRFAPSDAEQVGLLLDIMNPPTGARVLDAGCGIGEAARLMHLERPDLSFLMVNLSTYQLSLCPTGPGFIAMAGDCHALDLPDGCVDAVMFSSALCQMDARQALGEAYRVMRPGGTLLVNDLVRAAGDAGFMEHVLGARVRADADMLAAIGGAGFDVSMTLFPHYDDSTFRGLLDQEGLAHLADDVRPIIIRARK